MVAVTLVAIAVALSMCIGKSDIVDERAKAFTVADVDGAPHTLSDYRGRVLLIEFFATWCTFCADQHEELVELWPGLDPSEVALLQIDQDDRESEEQVRQYRDDRAIEWPVAPGGGRVASDYDVDALPTIVVVDGKGVVRYHHTGVVKADKLEDVIQDLL
jgi:cytochrome c biogenesis protein CcmG/thiol:disulfide interchange protein DsbE